MTQEAVGLETADGGAFAQLPCLGRLPWVGAVPFVGFQAAPALASVAHPVLPSLLLKKSLPPPSSPSLGPLPSSSFATPLTLLPFLSLLSLSFLHAIIAASEAHCIIDEIPH